MTRWLDEDEQRSWRAWIASTTLLRERLSRELEAVHGISLGEYEVLVRLSEAPDRRLRMSALAQGTLVSRSRLTHQIDAMVRAGLVRRAPCLDDRRGQLAELTDEGWTALETAAPTHVEGVRRYLVDPLGPAAFARFGESCRTVLDALDRPADP